MFVGILAAYLSPMEIKKLFNSFEIALALSIMQLLIYKLGMVVEPLDVGSSSFRSFHIDLESPCVSWIPCLEYAFFYFLNK